MLKLRQTKRRLYFVLIQGTERGLSRLAELGWLSRTSPEGTREI